MQVEGRRRDRGPIDGDGDQKEAGLWQQQAHHKACGLRRRQRGAAPRRVCNRNVAAGGGHDGEGDGGERRHAHLAAQRGAVVVAQRYVKRYELRREADLGARAPGCGAAAERGKGRGCGLSAQQRRPGAEEARALSRAQGAGGAAACKLAAEGSPPA